MTPADSPERHAAALELIERTRRARGLSERITDPVVIDRVATIARYASGGDQ